MLSLERLGQAGFALRSADTSLIVDPFLAPRPGRLVPAVPAHRLAPFDAVLATHEHRDHFDLESWPELHAASPSARFVVPAPLSEVASEVVPRGQVIAARVEEVIVLGTARVTPVPARHGVHVRDAYTFGLELSGGLHRYLGFVIEMAGIRIYHSGDTIRYDRMAEYLRELRIDIALLPINGRDGAREARDVVGNLDHAEAADLAADAGIAMVIPMHYDMFVGNAARAADLVDYAAHRHPGLTVLVPGLDTAVPLKAIRHGLSRATRRHLVTSSTEVGG